jgi:hypothetical protein
MHPIPMVQSSNAHHVCMCSCPAPALEKGFRRFHVGSAWTDMLEAKRVQAGPIGWSLLLLLAPLFRPCSLQRFWKPGDGELALRKPGGIGVVVASDSQGCVARTRPPRPRQPPGAERERDVAPKGYRGGQDRARAPRLPDFPCVDA